MEDVVAELRERLQRRRMKPPSDVLENRLRTACLEGAGHLMVTGSDRAEIHAILARVLDTVQPLSAIRTLAVDADPNATVDRVISAFDPDATLDNYLDRRAALLELLARAEQAKKSIFVVVDDADRATIEQLERLRTSLEVVPEAIERLRLVLIGDETLPQRLEEPAARALRTRIAATVSMDDATNFDAPATPSRKTAASHALTLAVVATVAFCAAVYTMYLVGLVTGSDRDERVARAPNADAPPASRAAAYALRGNEPFLDSSLRIVAATAPRKKIIAPPAAPAVQPSAPAQATKLPAQATKPPSAATGTHTVTATSAPAVTKAPQPTKAPDATPSSGSSIDAFMKRFPAER